MHNSLNHWNAGAVRSPMIRIISAVNLISGSKRMLPPGDDSNMKPKSRQGEQKRKQGWYLVEIANEPIWTMCPSSSTLKTDETRRVNEGEESRRTWCFHCDDPWSEAWRGRWNTRPYSSRSFDGPSHRHHRGRKRTCMGTREEEGDYLLKLDRIIFSVDMSKVIEETHFGVSADIFSWTRVRHAFNHTALAITEPIVEQHLTNRFDSYAWTRGDDTISVQIQF